MCLRYLSNDGLSGLVILVEEVVGLNEQLTGVFLGLGHPLPPQQHGVVGAGLGVKVLVWTAWETESRRLNKTYI